MSRAWRAAQRGFTLIELLVVIAILAILLTLAAPSFVSFQRNAELTSAANSLASALNAARTEAMKRNVFAVVTPVAATGWNTGWQVFVDSDLNGAYTAGEQIVQTREALPSYITVTESTGAGASYLMYDGSGFLRRTGGSAASNTTISFSRSDVASAQASTQTRRLKVAVTGRVRVCTPTSSTDAACSGADGSL
ncbi:Pilus assembly protein FimT [Burkholderiales bacterium 8X]|nr:Pilus assembly protein FimT [Burkholderiales bacterium 8X]